MIATVNDLAKSIVSSVATNLVVLLLPPHARVIIFPGVVCTGMHANFSLGIEKSGWSCVPMAEELALTEFTNLAYSPAAYEVKRSSSATSTVAGMNTLLACGSESDRILLGLYT
jgi:hypothetical protein